MAPRSRTATLEERPTSSSGTRSGSLMVRTNDFDKRKSRDDLYLTLNADKQRFKSFHVPSRQRAPSPEPQAPGRAEALRGSRADSIGKQGDTGVIAIGMALGSPSHAPAGTGWQPQLASVISPSSASEAQESAEDTTPKSKPRMWGLFRSKSRAKRARANTEASSPLPKMEAPQAFNMSPAGVPKTGERNPGPNVARSGSVAVNSAKHKPLVVRSNTDPFMGRGVEAHRPAQPQRTPPQPPTRPAQTTPARPYERPAPAGGFHLPTSRGPLLDVEIPDITMERYSIMFGHVLQKKPPHHEHQHQQPQPQQQVQAQAPSQQQPPPQPEKQPQEVSSSSSLLSRRQATLGRLKTIEDESLQVDAEPELVRPRRATSPQPKNSPTFHLFPPTPKRSTVTQTHSPRLRSNTSPAGLSSPSQALFDQSQPHREAPRAQTFPRLAHSNSSTDRLPNSVAQTQRRPHPAPRFQRTTPPTRSNPVFDSPTGLDEPVIEMKPTYQPSIKEPAWDMVSPPVSTASSGTGTPKKGSLSSITSSEQVTITKQVPGEEAEAEKVLREAVEASITRQISVSREQRQLLGSLRRHTWRRKDSQPVGFGTIAVGKNERLVETKKLTPTVVHPDPDSDSPKSLHVHRRSERVIVEGE